MVLLRRVVVVLRLGRQWIRLTPLHMYIVCGRKTSIQYQISRTMKGVDVAI